MMKHFRIYCWLGFVAFIVSVIVRLIIGKNDLSGLLLVAATVLFAIELLLPSSGKKKKVGIKKTTTRNETPEMIE